MAHLTTKVNVLCQTLLLHDDEKGLAIAYYATGLLALGVIEAGMLS